MQSPHNTKTIILSYFQIRVKKPFDKNKPFKDNEKPFEKKKTDK